MSFGSWTLLKVLQIWAILVFFPLVTVGSALVFSIFSCVFLLNASQLKCIVFGPDSFLYPVNMTIQRHTVSPNSDTLCDRFQHAAKENHKLLTAWEISINTFSSKSRRRSRLLVLFLSDAWPRPIKWFLNRQPVGHVTSYIFLLTSLSVIAFSCKGWR